MIRRPPRSTQSRSSAASDVYKRQAAVSITDTLGNNIVTINGPVTAVGALTISATNLLNINGPLSSASNTGVADVALESGPLIFSRFVALIVNAPTAVTGPL